VPEWRPWIVPSVIANAIAVGGQISSVVAHVALFQIIALVLWVVVLAACTIHRVATRRPVIAILAAIPIALVALVASVQVVFGVPLYVRKRAAPAIAAIEAYDAKYGSPPYGSARDEDFDPGVRRAIDDVGLMCTYSSREERTHLTCMGVLFTKCTYAFESKRWESWD
jgi:hypothetical protein